MTDPIILGCDLGLRHFGHGVLHGEKILEAGVWRPPESLSLPQSYFYLWKALRAAITKYGVTDLAFEEFSWQGKVTDNMKILTKIEMLCEVVGFQFPKLTVTGYPARTWMYQLTGQRVGVPLGKEAIKEIVELRLGMTFKNWNPRGHESDALGIALYHGDQMRRAIQISTALAKASQLVSH